MKKKSRKEKIQDMQIQWVFLLFGTMLAILGGITVNALYDLLKENSSPLNILLITGSIFLVVLYVFGFLFNNLEEVSSSQEGDEMKIFWKHHKRSFSAFYQRIKGRLFKK